MFINVDVPQQRGKAASLGNTCFYGLLNSLLPIDVHLMLPFSQVVLKKEQEWPVFSCSTELSDESCVSYPVKSSFDVERYDSYSSFLIQGSTALRGEQQV